MKRRGFTLIELLAVIVILAIIALIATPTILNLINSVKKESYVRDCEGIEHGAELYVAAELEGVVNDGMIIPASNLTNYVSKIEEGEYVIVNVKNGKITYYYSGRDKNPYDNNKTLKETIENKTSQIKKNVVVNGETVNKVIGVKSGKETNMNNYVWYSGQLWQVVETNATNNSIKLVTAQSLTSIPYGTTSDWENSWVKKWLNNEFLKVLERTDLIVNTNFCMGPIDVTPIKYTKMSTCTNKVAEQVGLLTYEDYIYAKNGETIQDGGSFLDEDELSWLITPSTLYTNQIWHTNSSNPSVLTLDDSNFKVDTYGRGVRAVISIRDDVMISSGNGTKANPYVLTSERVATKDSAINNTKVGDYVYLDESNNPYTFTSEKVLNNLTYTTTKDKVRYRVVSINDDGSVKLERASLLSGLPSTIAINNGLYVQFYTIDTGEAITSCLYDTAGKYGTVNAYITGGCANHNIFNPSDGSGAFEINTGDNIAYYLNNASNSFYNWYSDKTKSMIELTEWILDTSGQGKDYSNLNDGTSTTYPNRTNDGSVNAYVGLPTWGEIYTGNDLNLSYWYINRWQGSSSNVSYVHHHGDASGYYASYAGRGVRPVIVVKSNVYITGGSGTIANPYTLDI